MSNSYRVVDAANKLLFSSHHKQMIKLHLKPTASIDQPQESQVRDVSEPTLFET